jgi:methylmalonyl-CoA mutase C-terminal domain/subunit
MKKVGADGIGDKMILVGGVIPGRDVEKLKNLGVAGVFPGGTPFSEIVAFIRQHAKQG